LEYDDLVKSGKELFKMNKNNRLVFKLTQKTKEFIANTAWLNKKGKAEIDIKGYTKLMSQFFNICRC
jgi:predicted transcriptional regulator